MKYKYFIYGLEQHKKPHVHIHLSDGRKIVLSLPDLTVIIKSGKFKSKELKIIINDLEPIADKLLKEYYEKNK